MLIRNILLPAMLLAAGNLMAAQELAQPGQASRNQASRQEFPVELLTPFGVLTGRLVLAGGELMFMNSQDVTYSLSISREEIQRVDLDNGMLYLRLVKPVQAPWGREDRLVFDLPGPPAAHAVLAWSKETQQAARRTKIYEFTARHYRWIGGSTGKLVIAPDYISYESADDPGDSRKWSMLEIRFVRWESPFKFEILPWAGSKYTFELIDKGMNYAVYTHLLDRIENSRIGR
jgi:hypothetical protein